MKLRVRPIARLSFPLASAIAAMLAAPFANAFTYYWDNNSTTAGFGTALGTWSSSAFWTTDGTGAFGVAGITSPTTSDALNFGNGATGLAAGTITVSGTVNAGDMTFASGSGAILLSGGTINLAAAETITVNNASDTISSILTGAATSLTKAGTGALNLSGDNSYTGTTVISKGILAISHSNALGTTAGNTTIATTGSTSGGQLALSNNITSAENITITGITEQGGGYGGAIYNTSGTNTLSGNITLASPTGGIRITSVAGELIFGGTISQTGTARDLVLQAQAGAALTVNNAIANNGGGLAILGSSGGAATGIVTLKTVSTAIGATALSENGTLKLGVTNALNTTATLTLGQAYNFAGSDFGTVDLAGFNQTVGALIGNKNTSNVGADSKRVVTNSAASGTSVLTVGNNNGAGTFNGVILDGASAAVALTKIGTGTQTLTGANTYTGATTIKDGTLTLNGQTGSISTSSALTFSGDGTFNMDNTGASAALAKTLGALIFSAGDGVVKITRTVAQDQKITFGSLAARTAGATGNFVLVGSASTTNGFFLSTTTNAPLSSSGSNNQGLFFGGTEYARYDATNGFRAVTYGTDTNAFTSVGGGAITGVIDSTKDVKITGAITAQTTAAVNTLNLGANNFTITAANTLSVNGLLSTGTLTLSGGNIQANTAGGEIVVNTNAGTMTLSSVIQSSALTKSGAGQLNISGANTYDGATVINGGLVQLSGSGTLGSAVGGTTIIVNGFGTLNALGARLELYGGITSAENITITGITEQTGAYNAAIVGNTGANVLNGNITLSSPTGGIRLQSNVGTLTFNGTISQTGTSQDLALQSNASASLIVKNGIANNGGNLAIYGSGTVTLNGSSGTGIGTTTISQSGKLVIGVDDALNTTANLTISTGGTDTISKN
ncbi:MAG: autotransporter-associated beta strand repeat-containing protein [Verrucomicrobiota bacterium]